MARERKGSIVTRGKHVYAVATYVGKDGKRRGIWRAARNRAHAKEILPVVVALTYGNRYSDTEYRPRKRGFIYAMEVNAPGVDMCPIKIGTSNDVKTRHGTIETSSPFPVIVRGFWEVTDCIKEESALHRRFASSRIRGEWFKQSDELLNLICERTNAYLLKVIERAAQLSELVNKPSPDWCQVSAILRDDSVLSGRGVATGVLMNAEEFAETGVNNREGN